MVFRKYSSLTTTWLVMETNTTLNFVKSIPCHSCFFITGNRNISKKPCSSKICPIFKFIFFPNMSIPNNFSNSSFFVFSSYFYVVDNSSKILYLSGSLAEDLIRKSRVWKGRKTFPLCGSNINLQHYLQCSTVWTFWVHLSMHL